MARRLAPVPETAPRALGLVRVSRERDGMVSPEIQRVSISDYSAGRGYELVDWVEGIDQSGSRARSAWWPTLEAAVAAVEAGTYDVLVVWKFSRAARHRLRWAVALDRVEAAGGRLESATEQIDVATSAGRFTRGMFGEVAAFEAERTGEGWKEAHASRVRSGRPHTGKPKFGYSYDPEAKLHRPDPVTGPVLADLYARYVAGESMYSLVRWLNGRGLRTTVGGTWGAESLRRVLDAGFGAGFFMAGGDPKRRVKATLHRGVHEPVIDGALWQAYLDARAARRSTAPRTERSRYVLSGLVRCQCGGAMVPGRYGQRVLYRCEQKYSRGIDCQMTYVRAELVDGAVVEWLEGLASEVDKAKDAALLAGARRSSREAEAQRLAREVTRAEEALTRLAVGNASTPLPAGVYEASVAELSAQLAALRDAQAEAQRQARASIDDPAATALGLLEAWDEWPVEVRRQILRGLLARVLVTVENGEHSVIPEPAWEGV